MNRVVTISLFFLMALSISAPVGVSAGTVADEMKEQNIAFSGNAGIYNTNDPRAMVARAVKIALTLVGSLFTAYTVYAGFLWMTAAGDEEKINKAKHIIRNGIIGIVLSLSAYSLVILVDKYLRPPSGPPSGGTDIYRGGYYDDEGRPLLEFDAQIDSEEYTGCPPGNNDPLSPQCIRGTP